MSCKKSIKLSRKQISILSKIMKMIENKEFPDNYPVFITQSSDAHIYSLRRKVIEHMGFILISKEWIKDLSQWIGKRNYLELMSGLGALSYGLRMQGVNIIATDNYSWKETTNVENSLLWNDNKMWTHVENLGALEAVKKYGRNVDIIIMSWPPYDDEIAVKVLRRMRDINPSCIMIYIGEGKGGCTANDEFFTVYQIVEDESFNEANVKFQSWPLIKDRPFLIK
ncbi:MAG TPA: hypothetical protein GXZ21_03805 [Clostridiales bacterium]|nr:hypothetical protein [Clostridiales bacterium]